VEVALQRKYEVISLFILLLMLSVPCLSLAKEAAKPVSIDSIQVLKIAAQDERAVIRTPDGKMQIIKAGDSIGDYAKVTEIARGRVVIEEKKGKDIEKVIIRLENGRQRMERIKRTGEKQPLIYTVNTPTQDGGQNFPLTGNVKGDKESKAH
jgi:hypothetical protein